ncbi:non-ribosomal peptide synthetase [Candidimonas nitroreducens]|nr:non-ribosomal peptide synthetase [Candidimonas nitroreducens]
MTDSATFHSLFTQTAQATPDAVALSDEARSISYGQLDALANGVSHAVAAALPHTSGPVCVGLNLSRSIEAVAAMLGVLKAGAAWVPLDPSYPAERLRYMLDDSGAPVVLHTALAGNGASGNNTSHDGAVGIAASDRSLRLGELAGAGHQQGSQNPPVLIDIGRIQPLPEPAPAPRPAAGQEDMAYVVYTSGSTGRPKGVPGTHRAMLSRFDWMWQAFPFEAGERTCAKTALNFVDCIWETFGGLLQGVPGVIVNDAVARDPAALLALLARENISRLVLVPSLLAALIDMSRHGGPQLPALRYLTSSGELLPAALARQVPVLAPRAVLLNLYGSSEMAADATCQVVEPDALDGKIVPIGKAIGRMRTYVLDEALAPVAAGEPGELCVSGPGLSRGYLNRPDLSAEKFLPNPHAPEGEAEHTVLFRSGDLVAQRPDGALDYLGRRDFQIKLRGFRIEPGEIETVLATHPGLRACAVAAIETAAGRQLAAFYEVLPGASEPITPSGLRAFLAERLADYLVPARYFRVPNLPQLPNGKLDRHRLTPPETAPAEAATRQAPGNDVERALLAIWQEVLGADQPLGVDDDFFTIGGDSIRAAGVAVRAREKGYRLTPQDVYQYPTLAELAHRAATAGGTDAEQAPPPAQDVPLSPMQRYYFGWARPNPNKFNVGFIARSGERLSAQHLRQALRAVVDHHPALRLRFGPDGQGGYRQWHADPPDVYDVPIHEYVLPADSPRAQLAAIEAVVAQLHDTLDIESGPVMTAAIFEDPAGRMHHFFFTMHELVTDALSLQITLEDLRTAYLAARDGRTARLPARTLPYHQWVARVMDYARGPQAQAQFDYWLAQADAQPFPEDDRADGALQRDIDQHGFEVFDAATVGALRKRLGGGFQPALIHGIVAALAVVAHGRSGQRSLVFHKVAHGREACIPGADVSRTVGWFITHTPITLRLESDPSEPGALPAILQSVSRQYRAIPDNGLAHSALRYYSDDPRAQVLAQFDQVRTLFQYIGDVWEDNYDGQLFLPTNQRLMDLPDTVAAENLADYHLHVYAHLMEGCLRMKFFYTRPNYRQESIENMAAAFTQAMAGLLETASPSGAGRA